MAEVQNEETQTQTQTQTSTEPESAQKNDAPREKGVRVYVGNLTKATKTADLRELVSTCDDVLSCRVVSRQRKPDPLVYGFVDGKDDAAAAAIVEKLNGMELNGKELKVELARIRQPQPPKAAKSSAREDKPKRNGERNRGNRTRLSKEEREEKRQTLPDSETLVFVANLPFSYGDEELAKAFEGFSVSSAKVSKRYNGKSRGFGLVEFENHEMQQKAIQTVSELDGREIIIRVAKIEQEKQPRRRSSGNKNNKSGDEDELHDTDGTEITE